MRLAKKIVSLSFGLLIIALMVMPLYLLFLISQAEIAEYQAPEAPVLQEVSIGNVAMASRIDVEEYVTVAGTFDSFTYVYQELDMRHPEQIRWYISYGDEVQAGMPIGQYMGNEIFSQFTGIVDEISAYSSDAYLKIRLFSPLEFVCKVDSSTRTVLEQAQALTTKDGDDVTITFLSKKKNADGTTDVRLYIESNKYIFGQKIDSLQLFTGLVYQQAIVLPADCVYQKEERNDAPWFVRQVTEQGLFLKEIEVHIGLWSGDQVCVTGISENTYYDSGYKAVIGQ